MPLDTLLEGLNLATNTLANGKSWSQMKLTVSRSCSLFDSLPASGDFCHLLIIFANSLEPDQADILSGLILIQTVWHPDGISKISSIQRVKQAQ